MGVDYKEFAKKTLNSISEEEKQFFKEKFVQLIWTSEGNAQNRILISEETGSIKCIGEAGTGKTTQIKKKYLDDLELVKNGEKNIFPIWIDLKEYNGSNEYCLEETIKEILGKNAECYDILLEESKLELFLDGYNEVIMDSKDSDGTKKKKLAMDIDSIHIKYPGINIYMTERVAKSNPRCLQDKVTIFKCEGMKPEDICQYCKKKIDSGVESIIEYINTTDWIRRVVFTPGKVDKLIELVLKGIKPADKTEFYTEYLEFILEREAVEKYETRIDDLKDMLGELASQLSGPQDGMKESEIRNLWVDKGYSRDAARELLNLAKELPILCWNDDCTELQFAYEDYYYYFLN